MEVFEDTDHAAKLVFQVASDDTGYLEIQTGTASGHGLHLSYDDQKRLAFALLAATALPDPSNSQDILDELQGLYLQASRERSHFYVGRVAQSAIVAIRALRRDSGKEEYEAAQASHHTHILDLDRAMNGSRAAKRPLLIDIKGQLMEAITFWRSFRTLWSRTYRHIKRGGTYNVLTSSATLQMEPDSLKDGDTMTIYLAELSGKWFVRGTNEFRDGRFEEMD